MTMEKNTPLNNDKSSVGKVVEGELQKLSCCQCVKVPVEEGSLGVEGEVVEGLEENQVKQDEQTSMNSEHGSVGPQQLLEALQHMSETSQEAFAPSQAVMKSCLACSKPCLTKITCNKCFTGCYCSSECMAKNENHTTYCPIICEVQKLETTKRIAAEIFSVDSEKLPFKMKRKLIRLVGERPVVNIFLNKNNIKGLWDTGAMVSVINELFLAENFPGVDIIPIEDFVGKRDFNVTVANQGALNIRGVAILQFGVAEDEVLFEIPFLVTGDRLANTIIGYNTIEHLATNFREQLDMSKTLPQVIVPLSDENGESMVNLLQAGSEIKELSKEAKLAKPSVVYPGCVESLRCKIQGLDISSVHDKVILSQSLEELCVDNELVVFDSPHVLKNRKKYIDVCVYNPTQQKIVLNQGMVLGQVSDIAAAYTLPVMPAKSVDVSEIGVSEENSEGGLKFNLDHLSPSQRKIAEKMLLEESDVFPRIVMILVISQILSWTLI